MSCKIKLFKIMLFFFCCMACSWAADENKIRDTSDLQTSATSAKLFNLGSLLGYGNSGYYPSNNRPNNYPNSGYYPSNGYYPSTGYYPSNGNYPSTGWSSGSYPTTNVGSGYYPTNTYYPSAGSGTNILGGGNGGYGGYGGNGGFRQYSGYWEPNYMGQRNRGYGYYTNTDLYGLPKANSDRNGGSLDRDRMPNSFRGYD